MSGPTSRRSTVASGGTSTWSIGMRGAGRCACHVACTPRPRAESTRPLVATSRRKGRDQGAALKSPATRHGSVAAAAVLATPSRCATSWSVQRALNGGKGCVAMNRKSPAGRRTVATMLGKPVSVNATTSTSSSGQRESRAIPKLSVRGRITRCGNTSARPSSAVAQSASTSSTATTSGRRSRRYATAAVGSSFTRCTFMDTTNTRRSSAAVAAGTAADFGSQ